MLKISRTFRPFALFLIFSIAMASCGNNKHKVDLGDIEVKIKAERYEDLIFSVKDLKDYQQLIEHDTVFFKYYLNNIIGDVTGGYRNPDQRSQAKGLVDFVNYPDMQDLLASVKTEYDDIAWIEDELSSAFTYYKYHFADKEVPEVITFVSPFRTGIAVFEGRLGIGLDMYLGDNFGPYQTPALNLPNYIIKKLRSDYIVPNAIKAWLLSEFEPVSGQDRFIDKILYEGKILYSMDALFPDMEDSLKIGYFEGELEWNKQNEFQIFEHINSNELLFTSNERSFIGLLQDGPFSKGAEIPQDAPPRIGAWLGWQIVRQYMDQNPNMTLTELWEEIDSEKILKESKYKP